MSMCGYCTTPQACAANGCAYLANRAPHDLDARALKARLEALTVERDAFKAKLTEAEYNLRGASNALGLAEAEAAALRKVLTHYADDNYFGVNYVYATEAREALSQPGPGAAYQERMKKLEAVERAALKARTLILARLVHGDDAHREWLANEIDFVFAPFDRAMAVLGGTAAPHDGDGDAD